MNKIILITVLLFSMSINLRANVNCKDLPGFKKIGKDSLEYTKCIAKKSKELGKKG